MASHLKGRIDLSILRESFRRELLDCLDKCGGSKAIVWDDALTGPFGLIAEYSLLKEHEVDKMFPLRPGRLPTSSVQNIIFIVRPNQDLMKVVAQNVIREEEQGGFRKEFHIFFVPRKSLLCEKTLKEQGVYGNFQYIEEFCLDFVPFDNDLLSLEMTESYRQCNLEHDPTSLFYVAKGLMTLQALYGIIPNIHGKGDNARQVVDMMLRMRREAAGAESTMTPQIDQLLVIDRNVDPLTPLLSQLTYEGLIDEYFGISNNTVRLPAECFSSSGERKGAGGSEVGMAAEPKKFILNSGEELYAELRDKNFNAVGQALSKKAKIITAQYDARHDAKTVSQMKEFVSKLPHMQTAKQSLATHTTIAEMIKEITNSEEFLECLRSQQEFINGIDTDKANTYIEDCIAQQHDIMKVLKLMCIQCFCNNGLRQKVYDHYRREIVQTYGYQHLLSLDNLEKCGLLHVQASSRRTYPTIRTSLRLIVEEVNELVPNDIAYVFSGYAPLSVRLAERLHRPGWRSITEVLNLLPGPTIDEIQQLPIGLRKRRGSSGSISSQGGGGGGGPGGKEQDVTLVLFLGGVTYAEVSALRHLAHVEDAPTDYIIATTKIINGSSWLSSVMDTLEPKPVNPF